MKKYSFVAFLVLIATTVVSCNDSCQDVDAPESPSIFVEFVDTTTGNNVFTDSIFYAGETTVKDYLDEDLPYSIVDTLNLMHIVIEDGIKTNDTIFINLNNSASSTTSQVKIIYSTYLQQEECYSQYKTNNISIPDFENQLVDEIYKVKVN